jgi:hypothetical protein
MVRSAAQQRVSNHEAPALRRVNSGPASFETHRFAMLLRMRREVAFGASSVLDCFAIGERSDAVSGTAMARNDA